MTETESVDSGVTAAAGALDPVQACDVLVIGGGPAGSTAS